MKPDIQMEIANLRELLEQYSGGWAWIEELLPSHSRLSIVLSDKDKTKKVTLFIPSCSDIRAPINWSNSQLKVEHIDLDASPPKMALTDASNNIRIKFEGIACW